MSVFPLNQPLQNKMDFRAFEATPGISLVVLPNAPTYTIVAVSNDFVSAFDVEGKAVLGKGIFQVFPYNSDAEASAGSELVKASFNHVLQHKTRHEILQLRYDILSSDGSFHQRHWKVIDAPIMDDRGEVAYIIHTRQDITQQVLQAQQDNSSNGLEKAYQFFMSAPVIIGLLKSDDYIIELANEGLLEVWGKTADVIGKPLLEAIPGLEAQGFKALLDRVRLTGEVFSANAFPIVLNRNGKDDVVYFDFIYKPFYENNTEGVADGIISVGHDVTAQVTAKQKIEAAQKEAEQQKRLYETINNSTPDLIYVFDLNYKFAYANKALLDMWGSTWTQSIGKGLLENGYEPWHAAMHEKEIDTVVATRMPVRGEVSFPHATLGKRIYDYIFVPVFNEKGDVESVAGTTRDITDIKLAEQAVRESNERFRNLADESPIFIFIIDADPLATVNYWNKTWLQYTGRTMEEAIGRAWDGILHPDDVGVAMEYYSPAFQKREPYFIPAVRVRRHDGVYRWHAFKGNPLFPANGIFQGYIGVGLDIHDQKLAEEALRKSESGLQLKIAERTAELERTVEELRRSNANLEEFAYAASHDLKEPIRKIHFFGERLSEALGKRLDAEEKRYFERMQSAATRMGNLIDDLLSYSQVSIRPRSFEEVNLNQLVDQVLEDLDLEIEDKEAVVTTDKLFTIRGHRGQLQQAFQNLISNALKYSRSGVSPHIQLSCSIVQGKDSGTQLSVEDQQKPFYAIAIADNGIGFEQSEAERIFNVFTRLHGNAEYKGTGIGLSIVRKVIENHHGRIWAVSQPGEGATFRILLPVD